MAGIIGIPGRLQLEWVAAFARNPRPTSSECAIHLDASADSPPPGTIMCTCGMMGHGRAPGVQDGRDGDLRTQMLRVGRDRDRGFGRRLEQQIVDHALVLVGDIGDRGRQRVDDMKVRHREQLGLALGEPLTCRRALALGAVPVAATIVADDGVRAQCSQRATWPPRAAERQRSIADVTFSWARLTWLACAARERPRDRGRYPLPPELDGTRAAGRYCGGSSLRFGAAGRAGSCRRIISVATRV